MQQEEFNVAATHAYFELVALNMRLWRPEVADWLHSDDAQAPLMQLLSIVPCSPTVH